MSNEILDPEPSQPPSFEEFKETILQQGTNTDFLNRVVNLHGKIPRLIRILHNFDPTGTLSAIDQVFNEKKLSESRKMFFVRFMIWLSKFGELKLQCYLAFPTINLSFCILFM